MPNILLIITAILLIVLVLTGIKGLLHMNDPKETVEGTVTKIDKNSHGSTHVTVEYEYKGKKMSASGNWSKDLKEGDRQNVEILSTTGKAVVPPIMCVFLIGFSSILLLFIISKLL